MKVKISYKGWIKSSWTKAIVLIVSLLLVVNVSSVVQSLDFEDGYRHHADETEVEMSIEETKDTRKNDEDSQETAALGDSPDKSKRENPSPTAYDIYDWNDLNDVRNDLSGTYYLQNDLDSNMSDYGGIGDNWDPIGDFEGTFDGQGYTIESLVVDSSSPGLFGYGTVGTIKNLGLRNVDISGDTAGSLVGTLDSGGLVKQCWVNGGTVDGVNSWDAGGLVGFNYGDVKDCYVRGMGAVKNADNIGGLVGSNGDSGTYGGLENTYAANFSTFWANTYLGTVIGVNWQGGEAYESSTGSLDTWSDPIGDDLGISSGIDGGLPTSTMQSYSHFNNKGWDITSVSSTYDRDTSYTWNIVDGSSYPFLSIKDVPNRAPDALSNPSPSDGATGVRTNPTLEVDVSDPDGDDMDVSFYDASNDNLIGTDSSVSSGSTASVTWSGLTSGTTYSWYAVADDGEETTKSDTWSFTTNAPPTVDLTRPDGGEHLMAADTETIWWNMSDEDVNSDLTVDLYYSKDNGSNWNTITTGIAGTANPNSYDWTVPNVQSSDCLVKAEVTDTVGSSSTDQSAGVFTIDAYKLTINSTIGGEVTVPGEGDFDHGAGESVTLEAVPDPDYHFKRWSGENDTISDPTSNQTTITVQENHNITAEFIQKGYDLTLSSTIGGSITRPGEDTFTYNASEVVDIEAEPDEHYHFVRWSGDNDTVGDPAVNSTTIEMLDHYEITARFALDVYELNLNVEGEGNISPEQGSHSYEYGEKVTIETQPDDNWTFSHWTGDIPESDEEKSEITITMEGDRSLTAHFVRKAYFDVTIDSPEEGEEYLVGDEVLVNYTITNLGEIEDTQMIVLSVYDEQEDLVYEDYEEVTLGDPEKKGSDGVYEGEFTWVIYEGRIGNFDLVVKSEDAEKEVGIKVKEISEYELTVKTLGEGTTDPDPGTYNHTEGENVTIEAIPEEDWVFKEWRGDVAEGKQEEKEINMTIDSNRSLTAVFNRTSFFEIEKVQFEGGKELVEGEDLIIEYTIANAGDIEGTSLVNLTVYNDSDSVVFEDTERVTLEGDNEYVGTFNWETEEGDAGEYYMVLSSKDDEREVSEEIKINTGSQENSDSTGESSYTWLYILISLLLLSLILIPLFFLREREEEDKIPEQSQTWDENKPVTGTDYEEDTPKQRIQETGSPNTGKKWSQGAEDQRAQSVPRKKVMKKKKKVKKVKKKDPSAQEDLDEEGEKEEEKKLEEKLDEELEQLEKEVDEEEESPETEEEIEDVGYTECPLCGNEVQVDAEKCFACGKDLTED